MLFLLDLVAPRHKSLAIATYYLFHTPLQNLACSKDIHTTQPTMMGPGGMGMRPGIILLREGTDTSQVSRPLLMDG